jgi:hypothetical protein
MLYSTAKKNEAMQFQSQKCRGLGADPRPPKSAWEFDVHSLLFFDTVHCNVYSTIKIKVSRATPETI